MSSPIVLILGAKGRFGQACAQAFARAGWRVMAQARRGPLALPLNDTEGLVRAAVGARVVVYAVNPPYTRWTEEMMPLARAGMEVARRLSATFVLPGNVYAFGEGMPALLQESTPERPTTEKGRQRQALEAEMAAQADRGLRSIVIRAGDFFGHGRGNWFDQLIVKEVARGRLCYPGPMQVPHAWTYLPDLARCVVALASRDDLPMHARFHFPGHTLTGAQLLDGIEAAARSLGIVTGAKAMKRSSMSWTPLRLAGLIVPLWRELAHMSYLWRVPHELDGRALSVAIGAPPATPLDEALRASLLELGHGTAGFPAAQAAA